MMLKTQSLVLILLATTQCDKTLIKECPEEKIINKMPSVGSSKISNEYYIYKGERREIIEFDTSWVNKNCSIPETKVY